MRLWSLHPKYLDGKGLVALWREGLLAQKVLQGKTTGYKRHPQLTRFRAAKDPLKTIGAYLSFIRREADGRGFVFDRTKIVEPGLIRRVITVNKGQLEYERRHLRRKLKRRLGTGYNKRTMRLVPNPIFKVITGKVESWEKL
ncbi:MAG: pyrimidine dimer DNA glycosylase/endonuclease V [Candidatus Margulisbacteria bacterium]|nr:pyrimidine dimer DNA glycosylase/endonuclease V [Candidatus Margulisiibacteriota bacterium]MBU1616500.1 pyrimidine dimer DNA glycosylase/endonuclease V [Candidatus Margulisiibacteriota bacterium]MBU1867288.1 pyrimidine dimer DNA glycosylase/endonuclease V [Candidatus Margulisiibacteriota bacterium]